MPFSDDEINELITFLKSVNKKVCPGYDRHAVFLTDAGHVYTRGLNNRGQLGLGDYKNRYRHEGHLMPTRIPNLENIIDIRAGTHHTLCLNNEGHVYVFGDNMNGQLGLGDVYHRTSPTLITALNPYVIVDIQTNSCVSYFLDAEGNVYSCGGFNGGASLGLGRTTSEITSPKKISDLPAIKEIIPGGTYVCFLTTTGEVYICGNFFVFNTHIYKPTPFNHYIPFQLPPIQQIACLSHSLFFLTEEGAIFIYGKLAENALLKRISDIKLPSLVQLKIDSIIKFQVSDEQLIFISKDNVFVYFMKRGLSHLTQHTQLKRKDEYPGEMSDFLEYSLTLPKKIIDTQTWMNLFSAPLFKADENLAKECRFRVSRMNDNRRLQNQLLLKSKMNLALTSSLNLDSDIEAARQLNNKKPNTIPSLKVLCLSFFLKPSNETAKTLKKQKEERFSLSNLFNW